MGEAITANRLRDGAVVWLGEGSRWVENVTEAALFGADTVDAALAAAAAAERARIVVAAYKVEAERRDGAVLPTSYREQLRALGPSVRRDLGFQAASLPGLAAVADAAGARS